ncbi:MAG: tyrosine-protein phosphatase [Atopobiaceae bacterium]|nr:tyrosine-protein phosphatase [Atopobiaceae bacterium]
MKLDIHSIANIRDLGGYDTPLGPTVAHRFLRCGSTSAVNARDLKNLQRWGVRRVLDLRSAGESPRATCRFAHLPWVTWENVGLYDVDISSPTMMPAHDTHNYLVTSYLHMLATDDAIRRAFAFCAEAQRDECVLFHCAAGMDRTGMLALMLLGLVDVPREQIVADYCYSFGQKRTVDKVVRAYCSTGATPEAKRHGDFFAYLLRSRMEAVSIVYDTLVANHGSVRAFLESCKVPYAHLEAVRAHLLN